MKTTIAGTLLFRSIALFVAFLATVSMAKAEEQICKMTMCGNEYSRTSQPNFVKTKTQTIRVFVKFGDQVEVVESGANGVACTIGSKRGLTANSCDTYVDINITPSSSAVTQNGVTISLYGRPFGVKTLTCSFRIDIKDMPTLTGVAFKSNGAVVTTVSSGRPYRMELRGSLLLSTAFTPSGMIQSATKVANATNSLVAYDVVFATNINARLSNITIEETQTFCRFNLNAATSLNVLTKADIVPNGLVGKITMQAGANCLNLSLGKLNSDATTLNTLRTQIPAPSNAQTVVIRDVVVPNITWSIKNTGGTDIPAGVPFRVELWKGVGQLVTRVEVTEGLRAGETKTFTYTRPSSTKKLFRAQGCSGINDIFFHQDNVSIAANNWSDPAQFTIKVDSSNQIDEQNEGNNSSNF